MCHNPEPSLTIIIKDGDQCFKNIIQKIMSKKVHNDIIGASIMELHNSFKWVVLIELQWVTPYIWWVTTLQLMQLVC